MLNKPINPEPYNTYITKDKSEIIGCDIAGNKKIIGDYTKVVDIETSETVFEAYSQYENAPKSRIEYDNVLVNAESGKEYSWNTFYWEEPNDSKLIAELVEGVTVDEKEEEFDTIGVTQLSGIGSRYAFFYCALGETSVWGDVGGFDYCSIYNGGHGYTNPTSTCIEYEEYNSHGYERSYHILENELKNTSAYVKISMKRNDVVTVQYALLNSFVVTSRGSYDVIRIEILDVNREIYNNIDITCKVDIYTPNDGGYGIGQLISLSYNTDENDKILEYYLIKDVSFETYTKLRVYPSLKHSIPAGAAVTFYPGHNWNISPDYYFRCKAKPTISINSTSEIKEVTETTDLGDITKNKLHDIESDFKVIFAPEGNCTDMNYYQLHYYIKSDNDDYVLVEKSNKLFPDDAGYSYKGFVNGGSYKVVAICVDNDGDEWTEELCFNVSYDIKNSDNIVNYVSFNDDDYSIKVNIENMISNSFGDEWHFKIYKQRSGYLFADYVGECSSWYPKLADHNIQNDMNYTYFLKATKNDGSDSSGIEGIYNIGEITPVFVGSCIMGLKKTSDNTYRVAKVFHLNYHFNDCMHESTQELIRDYSGTFGKYQQEIKGSANYLTGVAEGLLGYEVDGGYTEPNNIKNDWLEFINDDSLKLYKGMDGNTMLVSITTSKIKPRYYEEYGLVNEVNISYKQIGDTNNIAIYDLEV